MAKKIKTYVTLQIGAGKANPAPPIGPALAQHGVNLMGFCKEYNARTSSRPVGEIIPAKITIYTDGSFTFELKSSPAPYLILKAAGVAKGSPTPQSVKVGKVTRKQLAEIAEMKRKDMNTSDMEMIIKQLEGTALNMGITVVD